MKFPIKDFFSKCVQIRSFLWIWSHLLKKSSMENFTFHAVLVYITRKTIFFSFPHNDLNESFRLYNIHIYPFTWESGFNVIFICLWEFYGSLRHLGNQSKFMSAKKIEYSIFYSNCYLRCIKPTILWMLSKSYLKFQIEVGIK